MYPVSDAFLQAVQENTREYYWTGKITTKAGKEYPFGCRDIVKGSGKSAGIRGIRGIYLRGIRHSHGVYRPA